MTSHEGSLDNIRQKTDAKKRTLPEDVLELIRAYSKPHPFLKIYPEAKKLLGRCFWVRLRGGLIGTDAIEVHEVLKNFLNNRRLVVRMKHCLDVYKEESIEMPQVITDAILRLCSAQLKEADAFNKLMKKIQGFQ